MASGVKMRSVRARNQVESATMTAFERISLPSQTVFTMEFFIKDPGYGLDKWREATSAFPRVEKKGFDFMQRSCNDQVRSGLLRLFVRLSMIGRTKADDRKKWEKHLEKEEEQCKPRVKKVAAVTRYKLLTQGDVEATHWYCAWPEEARDMALRNAILLCLKNPSVYQKCLEEDQTAERVIQNATPI